MKKLLALFLVALSLSPNLPAKTKLSLSHGTMKVGGHMQMPIMIPKDGKTSVGVNLAPSFAYFVAKSFAIGVNAGVLRQNLTAKNAPWGFSVGLNGTYYIDLLGPLYPYVGAGAAITWKTKIEGFDYELSVPVGMLIALNTSVAIDFGVPVNFIFNNDGYLGARLPVGYLGVQAFF